MKRKERGALRFSCVGVARGEGRKYRKKGEQTWVYSLLTTTTQSRKSSRKRRKGGGKGILSGKEKNQQPPRGKENR